MRHSIAEIDSSALRGDVGEDLVVLSEAPERACRYVSHLRMRGGRGEGCEEERGEEGKEEQGRGEKTTAFAML